jgi:5-methyltetrahydrofolate--homocysteine methyltransferase
MVSATINDRSGRTLTGQTLEAFYVSIAHYPILSFGLNCSFGVTELRPFIEQLAQTLPTFISIHPNAGLPNEMGEYDELPDFTASHLREMAEAGLLNIAGGCCGTDDRHIRAIAEAMRGVKPHIPAEPDQRMCVAGLEVIRIGIEPSFTNIGERTNVAGSRKFARLIAEKKYEEAAQVARQQIEGGAKIIDINMDDAMLDSREEMRNFVRYISNEPAIATAVLMIDSSDWPTVLEGLKNAQGKCIVNSISLKGGEQEFLRKARELRRFGAAVVVMAFDEEGQATTYERKITIAERAYKLLTGIGFPPQDIIFDVNILSVGTGIEEHAAYGIDFIRAVAWIKEHLPLAKTSGGVSNLSFAFRGNNTVREAMHSAFLYHAVRAGLDMGIVNPSMLQIYDDIEPNLLRAVEDVILNRTPEATETLIALADQLKLQKEEGTTTSDTRVADWRKGSIEERLQYALSKGDGSYLREDIMEALHAYGDNPVAVIEQPLMQAMEHVGRLFGEGKMFLPQVVKSAKVMREAVKVLEPELERENVGMREALAERSGERTQTKRNVVVLATANGDVHDIGKNIVGIVLACNNFEVHDLGVMVPNELILEKARELNPCFVGVSGLITPSLKEMENLCRMMQENGMETPLFVGGATTSAVHTALKLAPLYDGLVVYGGDASNTSVMAKRLMMNPLDFRIHILEEQERVREAHQASHSKLTAYEEAKGRAPKPSTYQGPKLAQLKPYEGLQPDLTDVVELIDWRMFLYFWGFRGETLRQQLVNPKAAQTLEEGKTWLAEALKQERLSLRMAVGFEDATAEDGDIRLTDGTRLPMLRSQSETGGFRSLADYYSPACPTPLGMFCVVAEDKQKPCCDHGPSYDRLMSHALCARLAEACVEWLQQKVYGQGHVIRPAFGYATCPDHSLKRIVFDRLNAEERLDISLTAGYSIVPSTSVCGLFISHQEAAYFPVGQIDRDQLADYCKRRDISIEEGERLLSRYIV